MLYVVLFSRKSNGRVFFFFSSRRRHTRCLSDWSSDVCSSDLRAIWRATIMRWRRPDGAPGEEQRMASGPVRNAPCPCGSGRKYKVCCLAADEARERAARAASAAALPGDPWPAAGPDPYDADWPPVPGLSREVDELWERFAASEYAEQIDIFKDLVARHDLDD